MYLSSGFRTQLHEHEGDYVTLSLVGTVSVLIFAIYTYCWLIDSSISLVAASNHATPYLFSKLHGSSNVGPSSTPDTYPTIRVKERHRLSEKRVEIKCICSLFKCI